MSTVSLLTIELIEKRPLTAVKVLKEMDTSDVADFIEALPTRFAMALVSKIGTWSAAALICEMTPANGAAILLELDYRATASIMRVVPEANRRALLSALPKKLSGDLRTTLTYPPDTVGAKMSTTIAITTADQTVGKAFAELRQIKHMQTGVTYIVDASRKLLGIVNADELFRLPNESRLGDVMEKSVVQISARARLSSVKTLPAWDDYAHLPVVNRQRILIGALARGTVRQDIIEKPSDAVPSQSIFSAVAIAFLGSFVGLAQVLIDVQTSLQAADSARPETTEGRKS